MNKRCCVCIIEQQKGAIMQLREYPDVLTIQDLMQILKIGKNTAYQLVKENIIPSHKIGRCYRIPKCFVVAFLKSARSSKI